MKWTNPPHGGTPSLPCPTREEIREVVGCSKCGAGIDEECIEGNVSRDRNHAVRVSDGRRLLLAASR